MDRRRGWWAFASAGFALLASGRAPAGPSPTLPAVRVACVATPHALDPTSSEVRWLSVGATSVTIERRVSVPHAPGAVVRGALVPGADVVMVAADDDGARDRDYGATLYRADGLGLRQLATGLVHASLPLPSNNGLVYVERGVRGALPVADAARMGQLRTDALSIDAIDPATGGARTLASWSGYALHLAGDDGDRIVVYRVGPAGAEIATVGRTTGAVRVVAQIPPFARDFTVQGGSIVLSNRDGADAHEWVVERIDLATGARARLHTERGEAPAPFALPAGDVVWTAPGRGGLALGTAMLAPLGSGFDAVRAATDDGAFLALVHVPGSGYDEAAVVHVATSRVVHLTTQDERVEPLGFVGARTGVLR